MLHEEVEGEEGRYLVVGRKEKVEEERWWYQVGREEEGGGGRATVHVKCQLLG